MAPSNFHPGQFGDIRNGSLADTYRLASTKDNRKQIKIWRRIHARDYFELHPLFINPRRTLPVVVTAQDYPSTSRIATCTTTLNNLDLTILPLPPVPVDLCHDPRPFNCSACANLQDNPDKQKYREDCDDSRREAI